MVSNADAMGLALAAPPQLTDWLGPVPLPSTLPQAALSPTGRRVGVGLSPAGVSPAGVSPASLSPASVSADPIDGGLPAASPGASASASASASTRVSVGALAPATGQSAFADMAGMVAQAMPTGPGEGAAAAGATPQGLGLAASSTIVPPPVPGERLPHDVTASSHSQAAAAPAGQGAPSLARQLTPAFVQLNQGASRNTVTLQLDPVGLGHVQVRIERDASGSASVQVTAEHPDTLRMLMSDQPHLHRALDNAGMSGDGRSLSFSLANPGGGMFSGTENGSGSGRQGGGRSPRAASQPAAQDDETNFAAQPAWFRAGVNITA